MERKRINGLLCLANFLFVMTGALPYTTAADTQSILSSAGQADGDGRVPSFYQWTASIPKSPGILLRKEPLEAELWLSSASKQYRILYTSTDGVGGKRPVAVSGAVFIPRGFPPAGGWPVIAWAHGTVGIADICAPSIQGRSYRDIKYLNHWLDEGYAIVATDYQGLGTPGPHPYLNTRAEAYSVLDSIRAAQTGFVELSRRVAIVGHSQGGQAAFAAAGYLTAYAPEIDLRGTVATGTPLFTIDGQKSDAFSALGAEPPLPLEGAKVAYDPSVYDALYLLHMATQPRSTESAKDVLTDVGAPLFKQAASVCSARLEFDIEGAEVTRRTAFKLDELTKVIASVADRLTYSTYRVAGPIFLGIGEKDEEVSSRRQLSLASKACAAGSLIQAHLYAGASHSSTIARSMAESTAFIRSVMAGDPVPAVCNPKATP